MVVEAYHVEVPASALVDLVLSMEFYVYSPAQSCVSPDLVVLEEKCAVSLENQESSGIP